MMLNAARALLTALFLWPSSRALACEGAPGESELLALLNQSGGLLRAGEFDALERNFAEAQDLVPCLKSVPSPESFAELYRLLGFARYVDKDDAGALQFFTAALSLDPGLHLTPDLVLSGHPALAVWQSATMEHVITVPVRTPRDGGLYWDGTPGLARPVNTPTVLEIVDRDNAVVTSVLLLPTDPLPPYKAARTGPGPRVLLLAGAGIFAASAVGGVVGAAHTDSSWHAQYDSALKNPGRAEQEAWTRRFESLERLNTVLIGLSIGAGTLAAGAGTVALVVPWSAH